MKGGLIAILMGSIYVQCKKIDCRRNIRSGASGNPIDTEKYALVYLFPVGNVGSRGSTGGIELIG